MKNQLLSFLFFCFAFFGLSCAEETQSHYVLVSLSPYKFFVEKIAGDTAQVGVMVPAGASSHTYEPSPKQMILASQADVWFFLGESFEFKAQESLKSHRPNLKMVDLRQNVDLITSSHTCSVHAGAPDVHIWLSPQMAKLQAVTIANALSQVYPEHRELYQKNLNRFSQELEALHEQIASILEKSQNRTILVSHPAYAYFCREFHLKQLSIEWEGKDPTPQQLTHVLNLARQEKIKTVFLQPQYSSKGAKLVAEVLGAKTVTIDPYSEDYFAGMLNIARQFSGSTP